MPYSRDWLDPSQPAVVLLCCSAVAASKIFSIMSHAVDNDNPNTMNWPLIESQAASAEPVPMSVVEVSKDGRLLMLGHTSHGGWENRDILQRDAL
eukprot:2036275-Prymnesium_polylepis.1